MNFFQLTVYARENILKHTFGDPGIILRTKIQIFAPIIMKLKTKRHATAKIPFTLYTCFVYSGIALLEYNKNTKQKITY